MTYPETGSVKRDRQRRIFANRPRRQSADRRICRKSDRKACAGRHAVVRPGIVGPRIAPGVDFSEIAKICIFQATPAKNLPPNCKIFGRDSVDIASDAIHALFKFAQCRREPCRRDPAVCIGCHNQAVYWSYICKPDCSQIHRAFPGPTGI